MEVKEDIRQLKVITCNELPYTMAAQ